ncbi:GNAT superfamily N-acetyltransferase [Amaricoccus macauensis]|uniref:GNAT superfamily N-acetyltransferase n=1 Tax=Amaricoccus macauensis TaxID=57001 RepID=A0A840SVQ0_9RHOB|nr:GNAT family N-acetyltransferase [Amaricoccus macauensis]MBB5223212.1 GNAT superfamily N-acetyltransferase [Amaricoccus macauensis]
MAFGYPHMSFIGYPVPLPCAGHSGLGLRAAVDSDSPAVLDHLRRLSAEDRRMRFCATMGAAALERHVERIGSRGGVVLLAFDGPLFETPFFRTGPVRAVAELVGTGREMELGISVDSGLRRNGIATELVETAAHVLAPRGVRIIRAYTLPGNRSFLTMASRCGAAVEAGRDEVEVTFDVGTLRRSYLRRRAGNAFLLGK